MFFLENSNQPNKQVQFDTIESTRYLDFPQKSQFTNTEMLFWIKLAAKAKTKRYYITFKIFVKDKCAVYSQ